MMMAITKKTITIVIPIIIDTVSILITISLIPRV